jgi:NADH dehydrogenase
MVSFLGRGRAQRVATQQQVYGRLAMERLFEEFEAAGIGPGSPRVSSGPAPAVTGRGAASSGGG